MKQLDSHQHIAYDLDGTLFGNKMQLLVDYIKSHPEKTHSVLTSRQRFMIPHTTMTLNSLFDKSPFLHIIHSPHEQLEGHQVNPDFKGIECKRIGATVLIDDWEYHRQACDKHNITFLNVNTLK